jgi:hypothetical protein
VIALTKAAIAALVKAITDLITPKIENPIHERRGRVELIRQRRIPD